MISDFKIKESRKMTSWIAAPFSLITASKE